MNLVWFALMGVQAIPLAAVSPQFGGIVASFIAIALLGDRLRAGQTHTQVAPERIALWLLLFAPPAGMVVAAYLLRGSLASQPTEAVHWQDWLYWLAIVLEVGLALLCYFRALGPRWLRLALGAAGLLLTMSTAVVYGMSVYDSWL